jgi:hypothetical protein
MQAVLALDLGTLAHDHAERMRLRRISAADQHLVAEPHPPWNAHGHGLALKQLLAILAWNTRDPRRVADVDHVFGAADATLGSGDRRRRAAGARRVRLLTLVMPRSHLMVRAHLAR